MFRYLGIIPIGRRKPPTLPVPRVLRGQYVGTQLCECAGSTVAVGASLSPPSKVTLYAGCNTEKLVNCIEIARSLKKTYHASELTDPARRYLERDTMLKQIPPASQPGACGGA